MCKNYTGTVGASSGPPPTAVPKSSPSTGHANSCTVGAEQLQTRVVAAKREAGGVSVLAQRCQQGSGAKPKSEPVERGSEPQAPSAVKSRPWANAFKPGFVSDNFGNVDESTFQSLREELWREEEKLRAPGRAEKERWCICPLIDADVGKARAMAEADVEAFRKSLVALETEKSRLPHGGELVDKIFKRRLQYKLYMSSGTATRPGWDLQEPAHTVINEAIDLALTFETPEKHQALLLALNGAMAIDDPATGASKRQFGKLRSDFRKDVALPALRPVEPRAAAMPYAYVRENLDSLDTFTQANLDKLNPIELIGKLYTADVTIHPCVDGNGRTALLATWAMAKKFGLPLPLITKAGTYIFHCQNGQATPECTVHAADAMASVAQGMRICLDMMKSAMAEANDPIKCTKCDDLAWMRVEHKCSFNELRCPRHTPKSVCEICSDPGLKKTFV